MKVWDTTTRQCEHTFRDHSDQVCMCSVVYMLHMVMVSMCRFGVCAITQLVLKLPQYQTINN